MKRKGQAYVRYDHGLPLSFEPVRSARRRAGYFVVAVVGAVACLVGMSATPANAAVATIVVTAGPLEFINGTPGNLDFSPVALNGLSSVSDSASLSFDVLDATGTGAGWSVDATSTTFTDGSGNSLPANATSVGIAPLPQCDQAGQCVLASTSVTYPYTLPAGNGAVATTLFNAQIGTGLGAQVFAPIFSINLPPTVVASTYSATWSFSLVSGP